MPKWKQLEQDICSWLSTFDSASVKFRRAIGDSGRDEFKSDGILVCNNILSRSR
jgi:hypothetical protein